MTYDRSACRLFGHLPGSGRSIWDEPVPDGLENFEVNLGIDPQPDSFVTDGGRRCFLGGVATQGQVPASWSSSFAPPPGCSSGRGASAKRCGRGAPKERENHYLQQQPWQQNPPQQERQQYQQQQKQQIDNAFAVTRRCFPAARWLQHPNSSRSLSPQPRPECAARGVSPLVQSALRLEEVPSSSLYASPLQDAIGRIGSELEVAITSAQAALERGRDTRGQLAFGDDALAPPMRGECAGHRCMVWPSSPPPQTWEQQQQQLHQHQQQQLLGLRDAATGEDPAGAVAEASTMLPRAELTQGMCVRRIFGALPKHEEALRSEEPKQHTNLAREILLESSPGFPGHERFVNVDCQPAFSGALGGRRQPLRRCHALEPLLLPTNASDVRRSQPDYVEQFCMHPGGLHHSLRSTASNVDDWMPLL